MIHRLSASRPIRRRQPASSVPRAHEGTDRDYFVIVVGLLSVLAVWIPPMRSSLWLDETGTFWVIQGSFREMVHRALDFQGQFPLYHIFLWSWAKLAGTSEFSLRLPSLLAALLAAWLCYRLALRLFGDVVVARLAGCIFLLLGPVAFAAADARPYAFALASLLGATLALVRWLQTKRMLDAIAYVGLTALTLYLHYLFALALIPQAILAYGAVRQKGRSALVVVAAAASGLGVLLIPAIPHFVDVVGRRQAMSLFTFGSIPDVLAWVAPPMIVVSFIVGRFVNLSDDAPMPSANVIPPGLVAFLGVWLVLPPLTLYVAGQISGIGLYTQRHFLSSVPALALLTACAFALLSPRRQRIALVALATLFVLSSSPSLHVWSDWRGAAQAASALSDGPRTPIFVYTGFSESTKMDWILDEERSQLFLSPFAAYPVEGRLYPLPFTLTDEAKEYVDSILASEATGADRILLITSEEALTYDVWLEERSSLLGYGEHSVQEFPGVRVLVFERPGDET
jgi:mannosyltransferase